MRAILISGLLGVQVDRWTGDACWLRWGQSLQVSWNIGEGEVFGAKKLYRRTLEQGVVVFADESGIF